MMMPGPVNPVRWKPGHGERPARWTYPSRAVAAEPTRCISGRSRAPYWPHR